MPQSYTVGIHGYVMVYSVTSMKRLVFLQSCAESYKSCDAIHSYDVVKVIYDKLLDQIGTNK